MESQTQPESGLTSYTYDGAGNLKTKTDTNASVLTYMYDDNERPVQISAKPAGAPERVTLLTYEAGTDNPQSATVVGKVSTSFSYDGAGRAHTRQDVIGGLRFTTVFDYDANDFVFRVTYSSGWRVRYEPDTENRIKRVFAEATGANYASTFMYHASGAVTSYLSGNGVPNIITYDPQRYWPTAINAGDLQLTYATYDRVGNVGSIGDSRGNWNQTFDYDRLDRLTSASASSYGVLTPHYDVHGNFDGPGYEYDSTLHLRVQNTIPFDYYPNGNLRTSPSTTYTYTPENLLETATVQGAATAATAYWYDGDSWRAAKGDGTTATFYLRDPRGQLLTEWRIPSDSASTTRDYIYAGSRLLAVVEAPGPAVGSHQVPHP